MGHSSQGSPIIVHLYLLWVMKICNFGVMCLLSNQPQSRRFLSYAKIRARGPAARSTSVGWESSC